MERRKLIRLLLVSGGLLLLLGIGAGVLLLRDTLPWFSLSMPLTKDGSFDLTAPMSMEDLAGTYPELTSILTDPELGTVYKEFLLAYQSGGIEEATSLARERGLLTPDGEHLRVTLVLDTEDSDALVTQLEGVGVMVVSASRDRVNISVPVRLIEEAMQSEDVNGVFQQLTELQHVIAVRFPEPRKTDQQIHEGEGVHAVGADAWHQAGFTGDGVRIGILDLGFAGYEELLGGDLPHDVVVKTFGWYDDQEVHGTACAEIVHELAPDAALYFAWYDGSDASMGEAVSWLLDQDADIITHSAGSVLGPRDGTGWDAQLVNDTVASDVLWVNSAGNEADVHYRSTFVDEDGDGYHDFPSNLPALAIHNGGSLRVYLIWNDSWDRPTQDLELILYDGDGKVLGSSEDTQDGGAGQQPAEWVVLQPSSSMVYAAVYAYDVTRAVDFDIFALGPGAEIDNPMAAYTVNSPGDAVGALTVGAVEWDADSLAVYSSQGPTIDERLKPDISAPTGVSGATYGRRGFEGTSASAPHVAGVAALVWQAYPNYTREDVVGFLLGSAEDLGPAGPDTGYGFGRLQLPAAPQAPEATVEQPSPTPTMPGPTTTPAPLPSPTTVAYVGPSTQEAPNSSGSRPLLLVGLLVGGLSFGGTGLLAIGGFLLMGERRSRRSQPAGHQDVPESSFEAEAADGEHCEACGAALRSGARFCPHCGTALGAQSPPVFCRHCGAPLRPISRFCPKCGKPI